MLLYEIEKSDLKKYKSVKNVLAAGCYITRNNEFIKHAFNFGHGTEENMNEYMKNNKQYCVWIDANTLQPTEKI